MHYIIEVSRIDKTAVEHYSIKYLSVGGKIVRVVYNLIAAVRTQEKPK